MPLRLHPKRYVVAWTAAMTQIMESDRGGAFLSLWYIGSDDMTEPDERRVDRLRKLVDSFQTPADLEWRNIMADAIRARSPEHSSYQRSPQLVRGARMPSSPC